MIFAGIVGNRVRAYRATDHKPAPAATAITSSDHDRVVHKVRTVAHIARNCTKARPMRLSLRHTERQFRTKLSHEIDSLKLCGSVAGPSRSMTAPPADMFRTVHAIPVFSKVIVPPLKTR
jgi:hypothetical protein